MPLIYVLANVSFFAHIANILYFHDKYFIHLCFMQNKNNIKEVAKQVEELPKCPLKDKLKKELEAKKGIVKK